MRILVEVHEGFVENVFCDDQEATVIVLDHDSEGHDVLSPDGGTFVLDKALREAGIDCPKGEDDSLFTLSTEDVDTVAEMAGLKKWAELTDDEKHTFKKGLESGLGCWAEIFEIALREATGN